MLFDIRNARNQAGYTQKDIAEMLGMSQSMYSRYEDDPSSLPFGKTMHLMRILGVDFGKLSSTQQSPQGIDPGHPYEELNDRLNLLESYIEAYDKVFSASEEVSKLPNAPSTVKELQSLIFRYRRKPNLVLTGAFDSGKSHLANYQLGSRDLPTGYTPMTKVMTFVRHVQDRPAWFKEDVWIVEEDFWKQDGQYKFDVEFFNDKERCLQHRILAGTTDTLQKYGVFKDNDEQPSAHSAVVYLDSPLLLSCNLVDLPGYSDQIDKSKKDNFRAESATKIADVLIYASTATGFIKKEDMIRLSYLIRQLSRKEISYNNYPTLGNLFIVATHAHPGIKDDDLKKIMKKGSSRLYRNLEETVFNQLQQVTNRVHNLDVLKQHVFCFWSETPERCGELRKAIANLLSEVLPAARLHNCSNEINNIKNHSKQEISELIEHYQKIIDHFEAAKLQYETLKSSEPQRKKKINQFRIDTMKLCRSLKKTNVDSFRSKAQSILDEKELEYTIREHFNDKKESQEYASSYIFERLQGKSEELIKKDYEGYFIPHIKTFLEEHRQLLLNVDKSKPDTVKIPFNFGRLFQDLLVGSGAIYIGALFGPIGLMIGSMIAGLNFLFGRKSWQERLAKQIHKKFEEKKVVSKLEEQIEHFWDNTESNCRKSIDYLDEEWKHKLAELEKLTSSKSDFEIETIIQNLEDLRDFFGGIPWRTGSHF